jgi:GTP-binding protein HflX
LVVDTDRSRASSSRPERAILVGVDFAVRSRSSRAGLDGARAAVRLSGSEPEFATLANAPNSAAASPPGKSSVALPSPGLDTEESLAEFRELVSSAGAEIAAEVIQRRPRPDPATLIGTGKVEEIAGIAASTEADLILFDHDLSPTQ